MLRASPLGMPPTTVLMNTYHKPMADWLKAFTLDDGYKPFDPDYAVRMAERLRAKGSRPSPRTRSRPRDLLGVGWWKHDPGRRAKLLHRAGFTKTGNAGASPTARPSPSPSSRRPTSRSNRSASPSPSPTNGPSSASRPRSSRCRPAPSSPPRTPATTRSAPTGAVLRHRARSLRAHGRLAQGLCPPERHPDLLQPGPLQQRRAERLIDKLARCRRTTPRSSRSAPISSRRSHRPAGDRDVRNLEVRAGERDLLDQLPTAENPTKAPGGGGRTSSSSSPS